MHTLSLKSSFYRHAAHRCRGGGAGRLESESSHVGILPSTSPSVEKREWLGPQPTVDNLTVSEQCLADNNMPPKISSPDYDQGFATPAGRSPSLNQVHPTGHLTYWDPSVRLPRCPSIGSISWNSWPNSNEDSADSAHEGGIATRIEWPCESNEDAWDSFAVSQTEQLLLAGDGQASSKAELTTSPPRLSDAHALPAPTIWRQISLAKQLWAFTGPDRHLIATAALCMVFSAAAQVCIPHFVGIVVDTESQAEVKHSIICLVIAASVHVLLNALRAGLLHLALVNSKLRLQKRLFSRLLLADFNFLQQHSTGTLSARLCVDCSKVCDIFLTNLNIFLKALMQIVGILAFMAGMSKELVAVVIFSLPLFFLGIHQIGIRTQRLSTLAQARLADSNKVVQDVLSNVMATKTNTGEFQELQRFGDRTRRYFSIEKHKAFLNGFNQLLVTTIPQLCSIVLLLAGEQLVKHGRVQAGTLVTFMLYQQQLASAFTNVGNVYSTFMEAFGAAQYVIALLRVRPEVEHCLLHSLPSSGELRRSDERSPSKRRRHMEPVRRTGCHRNEKDRAEEHTYVNLQSQRDTLEVKGDITLDNVTFAYPDRPAVPILSGVSLHVAPKEFVGVAGATGSGKTTLLRLIAGLVHADQGVVAFDGSDIRELDPTWLRKQVGVLWQNPEVFSGTINDNLYYGVETQAPLPCYSSEVCMQAKELRFTENFPAGYDTEVGDKGSKLSCGQRVRLALARVLNRQPRVLLVDDPLKQLGAAAGDTSLQDVLKALRGNVTIVVIVRSLETAKVCDRIYVVERGVVVQQGNHDSLMTEEGGAYRSLILTEHMVHM
ncbi:ABC transporter transmembrane region domain-containing protein [Besnoitia besnoiti]|uniref:ABC transporter transmembrane region domain-containing protein n=1 Tax=Besnoitia besnoiti TaxID=94643 RepID=A0A2A9M6L1_BESBE|nr:ABC transporter transmembrane region domain-containing protein [Besnoitia besnoiti]PFH33625.1 ABC transporter transmembrane region domain-containing protein [Besnoitia besnoiti]